MLTHKALINNFDLAVEKTSLNISCESSSKQMICMKWQDLFSVKKKKHFGMSSVKHFVWHLRGNVGISILRFLLVFLLNSI